MIELVPVVQLRLTFDDALTPVLVRVARKKAGVGMAMLFSLMLVAPMEPNDPVPEQAMVLKLVVPEHEMLPKDPVPLHTTRPKDPVPEDDTLPNDPSPLVENAVPDTVPRHEIEPKIPVDETDRSPFETRVPKVPFALQVTLLHVRLCRLVVPCAVRRVVESVLKLPVPPVKPPLEKSLPLQ